MGVTVGAERVVVIGAGHNGLVAGVLLARAGLGVTVVEAGDEPGGCLWSDTRASGHRVERGAIDHGGMVAVADDLGLADLGLTYVERQVHSGAAFGDGTVLTFPVSSAAAVEALGADGPAYGELVELAGRLFGMLDAFPEPPTLTEVAAMLGPLPGGDDLFRLLLSPSEAVAERAVADPHLRSALAMYGSHGQLAPWLPGTGTFALLLPAAHDHRAVRPVGGAAAATAALVAALDAAGGQLLTGSPVVALRQDGPGGRQALRPGPGPGRGRPNRRVQVRLGDGELEADVVVSSLDLVRTAGLVDDPPSALSGAARRVASGRFNVAELKVDLTFDRPLRPAPMAHAPEALWTLQPGMGSLRRAFGDIVAGRLPDEPSALWADVAAMDGSAAPGGGSSVWLSSVVPFRLADDGAWTPAVEEAAAERLLASVERVVGVDLRAKAREIVVTGPAGWARRLGSVDGNPNHLDLTVDQLLGWRPPTRTSLPWLYLSGAGTHPGGGVTGRPGRTAARAVLADLGGGGGRADGSRWGRARQEVEALWAGWGLYRSMRRGRGTAP